VRSHTCQVDNLVVLHSGLRKTSELQATFSLQAVGICLITERGDTVLDELFGVLQRYTLLDVHLCGIARLDGRGLKCDERGIAVWQIQRCIECVKVRVVLGVGRLSGVNHQIESVGRGVLDGIRIDREIRFVDSLLREVGVPYEDSGRTFQSACDEWILDKEQSYIGRTMTSTMITKARR
jgi:hypothetical protein